MSKRGHGELVTDLSIDKAMLKELAEETERSGMTCTEGRPKDEAKPKHHGKPGAQARGLNHLEKIFEVASAGLVAWLSTDGAPARQKFGERFIRTRDSIKIDGNRTTITNGGSSQSLTAEEANRYRHLFEPAR